MGAAGVLFRIHGPGIVGSFWTQERDRVVRVTVDCGATDAVVRRRFIAAIGGRNVYRLPGIRHCSCFQGHHTPSNRYRRTILRRRPGWWWALARSLADSAAPLSVASWPINGDWPCHCGLWSA